MDDLRQRFATLDRVAVPDLWADAQHRAARLAAAAAAGPAGRLGRRGVVVGADPFGRRRFAALPLLLLVALLILAFATSVSFGGAWWDRWGVLVPESSQPPMTLNRVDDCPGAVRADGAAPAFTGWVQPPEPGFLASAQPGRITALWHERGPLSDQPASPPIHQVVLVEIDPITRTACRLMTPIRQEQVNILESAAVPDAGWASHGDAFAMFRGDVGIEDGCCQPGELLVWTPGRYAVLADVRRDGASLVWSNDGTLLAVSSADAVQDWAEVGPHTISLYQAVGGPAREITLGCDPCAKFAEAFSPDDARLAVGYWRVHESKLDADHLIAVVDIATGAGTMLDVGPTALEIVAWQDDHTILALDGRRLLAIPVDNPSEFRVVAELPLELGFGRFNESWSPDLSRVAFQQPNLDGNGQGESFEVFVLDVATQATRHVAHEPQVAPLFEHFQWAPDSRTFAYTVAIEANRPERGVTLMVADALVGAPVAIAHGVSPIAWRPVWR